VKVIGDAVEVVEGFMIQARDRTTADALGTFEAVPGKVQVIDCFGNNTQVNHFWYFNHFWHYNLTSNLAELCHSRRLRGRRKHHCHLECPCQQRTGQHRLCVSSSLILRTTLLYSNLPTAAPF